MPSTKIHPALSAPVAGYSSLCTAGKLDQITRTNTAFNSFQELLDAPAYRPSLNVRKERLWVLACAYDNAQAKRGDSRRAHTFNV